MNISDIRDKPLSYVGMKVKLEGFFLIDLTQKTWTLCEALVPDNQAMTIALKIEDVSETPSLSLDERAFNVIHKLSNEANLSNDETKDLKIAWHRFIISRSTIHFNKLQEFGVISGLMRSEQEYEKYLESAKRPFHYGFPHKAADKQMGCVEGYVELNKFSDPIINVSEMRASYENYIELVRQNPINLKQISLGSEDITNVLEITSNPEKFLNHKIRVTGVLTIQKQRAFITPHVVFSMLDNPEEHSIELANYEKLAKHFPIGATLGGAGDFEPIHIVGKIVAGNENSLSSILITDVSAGVIRPSLTKIYVAQIDQEYECKNNIVISNDN